MSIETTIPPPRRAELLVRPVADDGRCVVKDRRKDTFFDLGPHEAFLLEQLNGKETVARICAAFEKQFGEPFAPDDLDRFLELAKQQDFLVMPPPRRPDGNLVEMPHTSMPKTTVEEPFARQSLLYWRTPLFDPDRFLTWLQPKVSLLWTRGFIVVTLALILTAALVFCSNLGALMNDLPRAVRWETVLLAWLTISVITLLHEFAHGLTCKRHGGEVREIGFLLMYFMPCFYCDVSDAWLLREKSKRLWVSLAGAYCDLCLWAVAVLVWRLALPLTGLHYLAWVVLTVSGVRVLLNFNPLIKLDGYYVVSDWLEIPNLRQRAWNCLAGHVRAWLWGAERPAPEPQGRLLFWFGLASWLFTLTLFAIFLTVLWSFLGARWGFFGMALVGLLAWFTVPRMFAGFSAGEVWKMYRERQHRRRILAGAALGVLALLALWPMEDRASGTFKMRSAQRAEVRAQVSGFVRAVHADEGDTVAPASLIAVLEVPDLSTKLTQKQAEVRETQAKLQLLEIGSRPEAIKEQRQRVARARAWRDQAQNDLTRKQLALKEELTRLGERISGSHAEIEFAQKALTRAQQLLDRQALPHERYQEAEKALAVLRAQLGQTQAQKRAREAQGTLEDETELARRQKELADSEADLALLEAGSRPEEIAAERARLDRLEEEAYHLAHVQQKQQVTAPLAGVILTARLREKIGQFLREGDLLCEIENPACLEAEIALEEQDISTVQLGQPVELKVRALPLETFHGEVVRVAPCAVKSEKEVQAAVTVTCRLDALSPPLRPGMTGYGRVFCGQNSVGGYLLARALRYVRTEFWW